MQENLRSCLQSASIALPLLDFVLLALNPQPVATSALVALPSAPSTPFLLCLTPQITERVEEAAQYICILDDLRPLQREGFNAFYEIWRRIARVPPEHRARLLAELEPGAIRSLWKSSMARYVLDEERSLELFSEYNIFCDFPTEPGEVGAWSGCVMILLVCWWVERW